MVTIKRVMLTCLGLGVLLVVSLQGGYRFYERLYKQLGKSSLGVGMIYAKDRDTRKDPDLKAKTERLEEMFKVTSRTPLYKDASIQFVPINVKDKRYEGFAQQYSVTQLPSFVLFKDSVMLKDNDNLLALVGYSVNRLQLKNFIEAHFKDDIQQVLKQKAADQKRRLREAEIRSYNWGPYWGGYGPYYYWAGPYWRWGYGGRCCW